jgi:hypothetical protein|tara:strand:- start:869 stop:1483 length:615 start_codon:yes stop_codon:yes gene_type:complete
MAFQSNLDQGGNMVTTFSGSDIKMIFGNVEIGNIQGVSWSINREVRPVFVMGDPNALAYSKNKRGVAGSIVMTCFDRSALFDIQQMSEVYRRDMNYVPGSDHSAGSNTNPYNRENTRSAVYTDEIPPFTATLYGMNEFGKQMVMSIHDITIISEGAGVSIDDGIQEAQFTYVAKNIISWQSVEDAGAGGSSDTVIAAAQANLGV